MSDTAAIKVRGLEKTYAGAGKAGPKHALKGIDLDIERGSMFALLSPNGAGKSTFINILAGLVNKSGGTAEIWGFDIDEDRRNSKASIGIVPQELTFDAFFTPREMLEIQAGMYGIKPEDRRTEEILKLIRLEDKADAYSRTLSGGMKRRLLVGKAMVHSPPILVLDEPTAGVDVELRQQLWQSVRRLHEEGVTVVLTTHYLEEAEELCDTIAIINHGEVVCCEPKNQLLSRIDEKEIVLEVAHELTALPDSFNDFHAKLAGPNAIQVQMSKSEKGISQVLAAASNAKLDITDITTHETDLEDIFIQLTQQQASNG